MADFIETVTHYRRQFLAPEGDRYDDSSCFSRVALSVWDEKPNDPPDIDAELRISSGYSVADFDSTRISDPEAYLAMITTLMEQIIAYRQAYADALAVVRGQAVTSGASETVMLSSDGLSASSPPSAE